MGSYRTDGNTATLLQPFISELDTLGANVNYLPIGERRIEPCTACWQCQNHFEGPGCPKKDEMGDIYDAVLASDCIIFASPIYGWYCTPVMKAVMDRLIFALGKYYGKTEGPCLWDGKCVALVATCGYEIEHGVGVLEEGLRRYSSHSKLNYLGKLAARDIDGIADFKTQPVIDSAKAFARALFHKTLAHQNQL